MKKVKWQQEFVGAVCVLVFAFAILANYTFAFGYSEDADNEDPQAMMVEKNLAQKREKAPVVVLKQRMETLRPKPALPAEKVLVRELNIVGATLLAQEEIDKLTHAYYNQNKALTGKEMQRLADLITRAYNRNGYITSYAYVVPEKLDQGVLEIRVVEGKTGKIEIRGNKYFSTKLLRSKIRLKEGQPFDFLTLNKDIYRLNKHIDRKAKLELQLDPQTQATDVLLTVQDKSPLHATLQADNYGAETILYQRYKIFLIHNNITGHDDSLTAKVEWAQADAHKIYDLDYIIPLNNTWKFEFYLLPYKSEDYYYKDNEDTDFEKRARKFYFWFYQSLIDEPGCEFVSSYGFTYFDIFWYKPYLKYGERAKEDKFRIIKWDLALNKTDKYGRWVVTNDLQMGIPNILGGVPVKSDETSVAGAKGNYIRNLLTVARRQKLFADIDFISKVRWQLSSATLTGVNAFSIGGYCGVVDNRGYPRTQLPADGGRAVTLGFTFPAYFIPRGIDAPLSSKTKLYDSLKLFTFWDWGQGILKSPTPADKKVTTLSSVGCGFTYAVPDQNLSIRMDLGWPLSHQMGVDGDHHHVWWSVTKGF